MAVTDIILKNSCSGGSSPTKEETLENKTIDITKNNIIVPNSTGTYTNGLLFIDSNGKVVATSALSEEEMNEEIDKFLLGENL